MPLTTPEKIESLGASQKQNLFQLSFEDSPIQAQVSDLVFLVKSTNTPEVSSTEVLRDFQGIKFKEPGKLEFTHTIDVTFTDVHNSIAIRAMYDWRQVIASHADGSGNPDLRVIKGIMRLKLLKGDGSTNLTYILTGVYPQSLQSVSLDYASAEAIDFPVTFSYDRWYLL